MCAWWLLISANDKNLAVCIFLVKKKLFFLTFRGQEKVDTLFFSQKILDKNMHFVVYVIMLKEILMRDVNLPKKKF